MSNRHRIEFESADGHVLAARMDLPVGEPRAWALFAHCFSCSKDIHAAQRIAKRLSERGIAVMRFDFTGLGHSEGDFANTNFSTNIQDLVAAGRWLAREHGGPDILIGHSLGGAAVIAAALELDMVKTVVTIAAPSDADHVLKNLGDRIEEIEAEGAAEVHLAGRPFTIRKQFIEDVRGAKVRDAAASLQRPLLVMHAPLDASVGIENASALFVAARHPKSFVSLDGADHLLSRSGDAFYAADVIAAWAGRYIGLAETGTPVREGREARAVTVTETGNGRFENAVVIGGHRMLADEPKAVGGGGRGPDPYEYVTAGLGACTAMTLRMYAARKGWPLETVSVRLTHGKDYAEDCETCEANTKVDIFERELTMTGDLDEDQRARLVEIADKCPVHRTLHEPVHVRTRLAASEPEETI